MQEQLCLFSIGSILFASFRDRCLSLRCAEHPVGVQSALFALGTAKIHASTKTDEGEKKRGKLICFSCVHNCANGHESVLFRGPGPFLRGHVAKSSRKMQFRASRTLSKQQEREGGITAAAPARTAGDFSAAADAQRLAINCARSHSQSEISRFVICARIPSGAPASAIFAYRKWVRA
jgi:hypothetical protein